MSGGRAGATRQSGGARQRRRLAEPLARLLLDSIDDSVRGTMPFSAYEGIDVDSLNAAVFTHRVEPPVYLHLRDAGGAPTDLLDSMRARYQFQIGRQLQVQADLAQLSAVLGDANLPWLTMKGPVLAERLWARPDLRQYVDLDILVDRRDFGRVLDALIASGAEMIDNNWDLVNRQMRAEVSVRLPNGTSLDLHWHVVNSAALRRSFRFDTAQMLGRAVEAKIGSTTVLTLDPADTLLHLGYHTAHSGGHRLMWLKDVERATTDPDLDWSEVLRRARAGGVELALAVVLARVARVMDFECPPPAAAFAPARHAPWGWFAAANDRRHPAPTLPSDRLSGQIAFKNTRRSSVASAVAALASLKTRRGPIPSAIDNPLHVESGGAATRASYLRVVEGSREP